MRDGVIWTAYHVQVLDRAFSIVDSRGASEVDLGVSELTTRVGLQKCTVHRLLSVLGQQRYVAQSDSSGKYRLVEISGETAHVGSPEIFTAMTVHTRKDLDRELARVRKQGFAIDEEEHELGLKCLGAPANPLSTERTAMPATEVKQIAQEFSVALGWVDAEAVRQGGNFRQYGAPRVTRLKGRHQGFTQVGVNQQLSHRSTWKERKQ